MQQIDGQYFFVNPTKHAKALVKIVEEYNRSDEECVTAFKNKYSNPFPPSWVTMEITSFGSLSILYSNLKPERQKEKLQITLVYLIRYWNHGFIVLYICVISVPIIVGYEIGR